jgi:hypothetical protein
VMQCLSPIPGPPSAPQCAVRLQCTPLSCDQLLLHMAHAPANLAFSPVSGPCRGGLQRPSCGFVCYSTLLQLLMHCHCRIPSRPCAFLLSALP